MTDKEVKEIQEIKDQVRLLYPEQKLDLSFIKDVEMARRALFFAEKGLKAEIVIRCVRDEMKKRAEGWNVFSRIRYFEAFVKLAPSKYYRDERVKREVC